MTVTASQLKRELEVITNALNLDPVKPPQSNVYTDAEKEVILNAAAVIRLRRKTATSYSANDKEVILQANRVYVKAQSRASIAIH